MSDDTRPAPLVPSEVDLTTHAWMPFDVGRLLRSETWIAAAEDPKLGHALISLWMGSWHERPAGSLPDNEAVLARMAFCDQKTWGRYRERVMKGWKLCSDGRWYHPVVAEKVMESWDWKLKSKAKTANATAAAAEAARLRRAARGESVTDTATNPTISQRTAPHRTSPNSATAGGAAPLVDNSIPTTPSTVEHWRAFFMSYGFDAGSVTTAKVISAFRAWIAAKLTTSIVADAIKVGDERMGAKPASPAYYFPIIEDMRKLAGSAIVNSNPPRQVEIDVLTEIDGKIERIGNYHGTLPGAVAIDAAITARRQYHSHLNRLKAPTLIVRIESNDTRFSVKEIDAEIELRRSKSG